MEVDGKCFEDIYKHWDRSGKNEFLKFCKDSLDKCGGKIPYERVNKDSKEIKKLLCSLCWAAIKGHLKIDQVVSTFSEVADLYSDAPLLLADLFAVLEVELSCYEETDDKERFNSMVLGSLNVVPDCLLKEKLDPEVLENMGLLQSKTTFQQKYVKTKTKIYYKQQKFNLLREESEGYSKLITELSQDFPANSSHEALLQHIQSLIGCFNLDPNRVLDIILDVFECRPKEERIFVPLLSEYAMDRITLCHILGFKFHFYQHTPDVVTKPSLYHVTALLLRHNLVNLDCLLPHLIPSDSEMLDRHKKELAEAQQHCQELNTKLLSEKSTAENNDKNETDDKNNQKLGLCEALLNVGCWEHAITIISHFPLYSAMSESVAQSLCKLIHYIIDPVYVKYSGIPGEILKHRKLPSSYPSSVRQAKTYNDLLGLLFPLARQLGPYLSYDPVLLVKINRLAKTYMIQNSSSQNNDVAPCEVFCQLMTVYDECILPSLTLMPGNCCISEDIWGFIKLLKYEHRYRLYGHWRNENYSKVPVLMKAHAEVLSRTKYIMKRLVKENVKQVGRQVGKLSHRAPGVIFEQILAQIQIFDNFIIPVVDSMKFITSLSYDVLAYTIIEALASPDKERLKTDGTNISKWLQSLANFSGYVLKKYQVDLAGLLHYITNQLKAGRSCDLYVLKEVIQKMAGIEVSEEITNDQLMSMGGGELLKQEAGYFTQVRNTKKSSSRLMDCLNEQNLTIPLCLMMSQQRNAIIFPKQDSQSDVPEQDNRHVKLVGTLYDQCQDTMGQFISFLSMQMMPDELKKKLPNLLELTRDYYISPDVAFALWRRIFTADISSKAEELRKSEKRDKNSVVASSQSSKMLRYYEAVESVMMPIRKDFVEPMMSPKLWEELNLQFYTTFWSLELYDLEVPTAAYENQVKIHQVQLQAIEDNKEAPSKKKKEKERCLSLMEKLKEEEKRQEEHVKMVLQRLKQERDHWFSSRLAKHSTISAILQYCLFPRCCFTDIDAIYCAKFLHTLHYLKTPNFSSLICYDRIFSDVTWCVSGCTANEAHRYGRFLNAVLNDIMIWHSDKAIYEKECGNFPGFMTVFRTCQTTQNTVADHLDYENFRHVVHKWHFGLTRVSVNCLESNDYIQMRNTLIVLNKVIPNYPKIHKLGAALEKRVEKVIEQEKVNRQDLHHLAFGYCGKLKNTRKSWILDHLFHKKEPENKAKVSTSSTANQQSDTNPAQPNSIIQTEEDRNSVDSRSTPKPSLKTRTNEDDDKSSSIGKSSDAPSKTSITPSSSSRPSKDQSKSSRDRIDQKEPTSVATGSNSDKRDGNLDQQRSTDNSPLTRKIRLSEQQLKVRDDWSGDHGHQQEESVGSNEISEGSHHRILKPALDERDLKRRKIDGGSSSKESITHCDSKDRSRRSPNYDDRERRSALMDWDRKSDSSKDRLDRKRQTGGLTESERNDVIEGREAKRHRGDDGSSSREGSSKINGSDDKRRDGRIKDKKEDIEKFLRASAKEDESLKDSKVPHIKDDSIVKERSKDHSSRIKKVPGSKESVDKEKRLSSEKHAKKPKAR